MARKKGKWTTESASATGAMEIAMSELESLRDEMGEWRDNLEEKFSATEKYERVSESAESLDTAHTDIENAMTEIEEQISKIDDKIDVAPVVEWQDFVPYKGRSLSRTDRLSNASNAMDAGVASLRASLDDIAIPEGDDNADAPLGDKVDELRDQVEQVETAWQETESVEFPGMFG